MITSENGIILIKHYESLHDGDLSRIGLQPKMCPAGYWTEGYGHAILDQNGQKIKGIAGKALAYKNSVVKNESQACSLLAKDLTWRETAINRLKLNLSQNQFDALVSFVYNIGISSFMKSTLLSDIKKKAAEEKIRKDFLQWVYADGKKLPGLVFRRQAEADLFFEK